MRLTRFTSSYPFILLLTSFLLIAFLRVIDDSDIWFHLSFGREILNHGIPDREFLVFTRFGESADYNSWGFGSIYFLIWEMFGSAGMALANAGLGTATLIILGTAAPQLQPAGRMSSHNPYLYMAGIPLCLSPGNRSLSGYSLGHRVARTVSA